MNKIYKVIWSKAKNCYVVASELAKSHTKSPKSGVIGRSVVAGVLACVLSCGAVMPVFATSTSGNGTTLVVNNNNNSEVTKATYVDDIAIGLGATATGIDRTGSVGDLGNAIAIGSGAYGAAYSVIALGTNSRAIANGAIAIGSSSIIGSTDSYRSLANGYRAYVKGVDSVSLGTQAVVLNNDKAVAIGSSSFASEDNVVSFGHSAGDIVPGKALASGVDTAYEEDLKRRLINVADGINDTDVATVGQLNDRTKFVSINGVSTDENYLGDGATGTKAIAIGSGSQATGNYSLALGGNAFSPNAYAISIGSGSSSAGNYGISIGLNSSSSASDAIAVGRDASASYSGSVAVGNQSATGATNTVSFGHTAEDLKADGTAYGSALNRRLTNVANGVDNTDVATMGQLRDATQFVHGTNVSILGNNASAWGISSTALAQGSSSFGYFSLTGLYQYNDKIVGVNSTNKDGIFIYDIFSKKILSSGYSSIAEAVSDLTPLSSVNNGSSSLYKGQLGSFVPVTDNGGNVIDYQFVRASDNEVIATGISSKTSGVINSALGSVAFGNHTSAINSYATAFGEKTLADGVNSTAFGESSRAMSLNSVAFGSGSVSASTSSTAFGERAIAGKLMYNNTPVRLRYHYVYDDDGKIVSSYVDLQSLVDYTTFPDRFDTFDEAIAATSAGAGANFSTAFGRWTAAAGDFSTAFGASTMATGRGSTAFGYTTIASGDYSTAFGTGSKASGVNSTAFGQTANASGANSTAIGYYPIASGDNSVAIGSYSRAYNTNSVAVLGAYANGEKSFAVGWNANAKFTDSIAIGSASVTTSQAGVENAYLRNNAEGNKWIPTDHAIAIGNDATVTRQITGLAAGSKDTDAVNVAQLKAMNNIVENRTKFVGINGSSSDGNYDGSGATGTNAIAIGKDASATNTNSIAIGTGNVVNGQNSGAIGDPSIINGDNSYSVGNNNNIGEDTDNVFILGNSVNVGSTGEGIVALGNNVTVNTAQKSTKARKTAGTSSVSHSFVAGDGAVIGEENGVAVGYQAKSLALNGTALGSGTDVEAEGGTAVGHNATVNDYFGTAVGYEAVSTGEGSSAFGQSANAGAKFATAFGRSTQAQGESSTAIGNNANAVSQGAVAIGLSSVANGGGNTSAVAVGNGATVGTATQGYGNAVAVGGSSNVGATSGTAVGHGASVTAQNAVALGQGSIANVSNTVSVGSTSAKRRVVNVADGTSATDGATVGQTIELVAGDNISITASGTNSVGQKKYTVGLTTGGDLITYDNSDHDTVTLDGTDGTRLTGLADGALLASSTDAVTGAQLYETNQTVAELESALTDTNTAVATNKTNITTLQTNYNTLNSTVNTVKADVDAGFNVNVNGTQVKNVNPDDNNINFKNGTSVSLTKDGNSVKVSVNPDGTIASGNGNALSGGTVYTEVRPASNGTYVKTANTTATNLTALDTQVKANADAIAQEVTDRTTAVSNEATARADADTELGDRIGTQSADGNYIKKSATNSVAENVAVLDTQLKSTNDALNGLDALAVKYDASAKTKVTLEGSGGTTISNVKAGTLSATSTEAVNGSQLYTTNQNLATETTNRTNADTELSNRIGVQAVDGNYIKKSDTNNVVANVAVLDSQLKTANDNLATEVTNRTNAVNAEKTARESADTGLSNRIGAVSADGSYIKKSDTNNVAQNLTALDTGLKATADALDALDGLAVQYDATNKTKVTLGGSGGTTIDNVKDGVLSASSKEAVNGSQLYKTNQDLATEVTNRTNAVNTEKTARENADTAILDKIGTLASDGNYIKKSDTNNVSQNLSVLDTQLKANTDAISNLDGLSVKYDSTVKDKVTLAGASGTTIDNVKDGLLSATSKEAVNGSQLFTTNQNLSAETTARTNADTELSNRIGTQTADGNYIKKSGTNNVVENIAVLDNQLKVTNDNLAQEIQDRDDADDALSDRIDELSGNAVHYDGADKKKVTFEGSGGTTLANVKAGALSATSMEAVNGSQLYQTNQNLAQEVTDRTNAVNAEKTARENADTALSDRIGEVTADGNYIKKSDTNNVSQNLSVLDTQLKANTDAISNLDGLSVKYDSTVKDKVTLAGASGSTIDNVKDGMLSATSKEAVNGSQLYQTNQNLSAETTARTNADTALSDRIGEQATDGNYIKESGTNNVVANVAVLDNQLKSTNDALAREIQDRTDADTALSDRIDELNGNAVHYDGTDKTKVTFEGSGGTILDNVKAGTLSATSMEAVNGSQLYQTNQNLAQEVTDRTNAVNAEKTARENADTAILDKIGTLASDGNYIGKDADVSTNLNALDTELKNTNDALARETTDRTNADTALSDRIGTISSDGTYVKDSGEKNVSENIGILDTNLARVDSALTQEIADRIEAVNNEKTAREEADTALSDRIDTLSGNTVHYDDASKAKITLEGTDGTTIDNVKAGTLSADSMEAVNGSQLYTTNQALAQEVSDRTTAVADEKTAREEADAVLSDRIGSLDGDGNYIEKDKDVLENVSALDTQLKSTDEKLDKEIRDRKGDVTNINNRIDNLTYDMNDGLDGKADANASNVGRNASTDNSELWGSALGTGRVAYGDMRLVTGGTVYDEVRPVSDGTFVKTDNSTGDNLLALDARVAELDGTMGNVVYYDDADRSTVTYGGSRGTVLANVKAGKVNKNSMEAVNGGQLWSVQQDVLGLATDVQRNTKNIRSMNTSISSTLTTIDTTNERLDNMDSLKADASLNNLTDAGKRVLNNYVYDAVQKYMADTGISGADTSNAGTQNTVAPLSAPLSAPMLMTSLRTMSVQDDPVRDNPVQDNGNNPGSEMRLMSVNPAPADTNYVVYDGTDASTVTLEGAEGTRLTNLADGALLATSTDAVTGAQLYETNQKVASFEADLSENSTNIAKAQADITEIKTKHEALQSEIDTVKTDVDNGFNVTVDDAHVKNVNPNDNLINFVSGDNVKLSDDNGSVKIDVVANGVVEQGNLGLVTGDAVYGATNGKADADLGNLTDAGRDVIREAVSADLDKKADVDANNVDVDKWSEKLGVGEIADGNTGLVNGGTVYNAIKEVQDNALVQTENDTIRIGGNSTASVIDVSKADGEGRVITGIATDPNDASSAANVAYVDAMGQNIINGVNNEFTKVNDRMDKVGAGAAAMAGLVPGSFDDGEKWNFSAAVGNYRSATAGAVGMFYKPTENVTLAVKGAFGNGENMVSGGVGIALSKGNVPGVTKRQLARAVNAQATKIEQLTAEREADRAKIAELERKLERLMSAQKQ